MACDAAQWLSTASATQTGQRVITPATAIDLAGQATAQTARTAMSDNSAIVGVTRNFWSSREASSAGLAGRRRRDTARVALAAASSRTCGSTVVTRDGGEDQPLKLDTLLGGRLGEVLGERRRISAALSSRARSGAVPPGAYRGSVAVTDHAPGLVTVKLPGSLPDRISDK